MTDGRRGRKILNSARWRNEPEVRRLHATGKTTGQIGKAVGMRPDDVLRLLRLLGLPSHMPHHRGAHNPAWRGGRTLDKSGYVMLYMPGHPMADGHGRVREHRLVIAQSIGRNLTAVEVVDHINGTRDDNRIENLCLYPCNADHLAATRKGHCPKWSEEGKARIVQAVIRGHKSRRQRSKIDGVPSP